MVGVLRFGMLILIAIIAIPVVLHAAGPDRDALFHIERNKNANIIQYDAQLGPDGKLQARKPVLAYWVRLAEQGQVKELSWIQRKFAYGFSTKLNKSENSVTLDMTLNIGRTLLVRQEGGDYRAIADINGVESYIDKIFIHATGKGISTRVSYIELYGKAVNNREEQYERFSR